jgi:hypothetical protein
MLLRVLVVVVVVLVAAFFTFPYWASCNLKYDVCLSICDVRHFNADISKAACKGGCTSKKIACLAKETIQPSRGSNSGESRD